MATTEVFQDWDSPYDSLSTMRTTTTRKTTTTTRIEVGLGRMDQSLMNSIFRSSDVLRHSFLLSFKYLDSLFFKLPDF